MDDNKLVKDITKLVISKDRHYGITTSDNLNDQAALKFSKDMTFDCEMVYEALKSMKSLNEGNLKDVRLYIPKEPYPLILDNGIQCYLVAPILKKGAKHAWRN